MAALAPSRATAVQGNTEEAGSNRMGHRIGAYLAVYGDPYPSKYGVNLAYNVYDFLRVTGGVGTDTEHVSVNSIGAGLKVMVPGLQLTPVAGLNFAFANVQGGQPVNVRGFNASGSHAYVNLGADWQTGIGVNIGAGYIHSFRSGVEDSIYAQAGFYL
jgi:hypothetical protein